MKLKFNSAQSTILALLGITAIVLWCYSYPSVSAHFPLGLRFILAAVYFALIPGFAIFKHLSKETREYSPISVMLVSCSLSFSTNFLLNILVYIFHWNISQALTAHFTMSAALLIALGLRIWKSVEEKTPKKELQQTAFFLLSLLIFAYFPYRYLPFGFISEELIVLRKLTSGAPIVIDQLSYMPGELTTYLFIPFYLLVAMIKAVTHTEVFTAISMVWAVSATISLASLMQISRLLTKSFLPSVAIYVFFLVNAIFYIHFRADSHRFSFLLHSPDRIGFSMTLLCLALFHYIVHMQDRKINWGMFVGLIYLVTEISFVHVSEAALILGIALSHALMVSVQREKNWSAIKKSWSLLFICGAILYGYKTINVGMSPLLTSYLAEMRAEALKIWTESISQSGLWRTLISNPLDFHGSYEFFEAHLVSLPGIRFYKWALFMLPILAFRFRGFELKSLVLAVALFGILSKSLGLRCGLSYLLQNNHIFWSSLAVFINLLVPVFAIGLATLITDLFRHGIRSLWQMGWVFLLGALFWKGPFPRGAELPLFLATVLVLALTLRSRTQTESQILTISPKKEVLAFLIVGLLSIGLVKERQMLARGPQFRGLEEVLKYRYFPTDLSSSPAVALNQVAGAGVLFDQHWTDRPLKIDPKVFDFINQNIPKRQVWLSTGTANLFMVEDLYSPVWSYDGKLEDGFRFNIDFRNKYLDGRTEISMAAILSSSVLLEKLKSDLGAKYILVEPKEAEVVAREQLAKGQALGVKEIFRENGYIIFEIL